MSQLDNMCTSVIHLLDSPKFGWPEGVEGVVAADEVVVDRRPRPAKRWTHNNPLTPPVKSPPLVSPSELKSELVELGVPTVGGFSILYLRNSGKEEYFFVFFSPVIRSEIILASSM